MPIVAPGGGNLLHVHPRQRSASKVLSGTFGVRVGDEERSLAEGGDAVVPPGTPHRCGTTPTKRHAWPSKPEPALNSETFFETAYGPARDGNGGERRGDLRQAPRPGSDGPGPHSTGAGGCG